MPQRIQRKRVKDWRMPEGAISVTRPGRWGNPFKVGLWFHKMTPDWSVWSHGSGPFGSESVRDLEHSLELFLDYATCRARRDKDWLAPLRGKDLACWCKAGAPCHADILLRLANS
jgi:hypothetical protein